MGKWRSGAAGCAFLIACSPVMAAALAVSLPPAQAQQAVLRAVQQIAPHNELRRRYRMALPFGSQLFPPDADLALPPAAPDLRAWLALPAAQRRHDLLVTPDIDYFWPAEDRQYSCQFLIHITAHGPGAQLAVLQLRPTEYAGKEFKLLGRTGPGRYMKLLPASPSAESDAGMRAFLAAALSGQQ
ncbi:hypothetical protein SAMN05216319_1316 [Duganella sp. CF402]|uniref:hypothetical protein n=1 Tax=unclassified Duganella TaxID=2636909 RepID=UPI0008BA1FE4|nr:MULTISPECIES: hypothetical protein [unclassified Duganella]RZT10227.1 hypothetical protein EV582_2309 [Duganella sp. BK701]SEL22698.1 hypothetical protein SAMN05216319_1316 [Duganella sp. CF402]